MERRRDEGTSDPHSSATQVRREPVDYDRALHEAESCIIQLKDLLAASQKRAADSETRADEAEVARDKSEIEQERILDELCALSNAFKELHQSSAEELATLKQQYTTALATSSDKENIAEKEKFDLKTANEVLKRRLEESERERVALGDSVMEGKHIMEGLQMFLHEANDKLEKAESENLQIKEEQDLNRSAEVKKELDQMSQKFADLKTANEDLKMRLEESEKARITIGNSMMDADKSLQNSCSQCSFLFSTLQISLYETNEKLKKAEKENLRIKQERDYFEQIVAKDMDQTSQKFPTVDLPSLQHRDRSLARRQSAMKAASLVPQISPPPDIDPFALFASCEGTNRKLSGDISARFKQLLSLFGQCDRMRLVHQTFALFKNRGGSVKCVFCDVTMTSSSLVLYHVCGKKHIKKMKGVVCADAFDFWWNAVEQATSGIDENEEDEVRRKRPRKESIMQEPVNESELSLLGEEIEEGELIDDEIASSHSSTSPKTTPLHFVSQFSLSK